MAPDGSAIGLDYGAILPVLRLHTVPRRDWPECFADLRVMEREAVATMRKR